MAGQWRIRHKLMLGLGLVVGVMAILLAGTVHGLLGYRTTTKLMESKVSELHGVQEFKAAIKELAARPATGVKGDADAELIDKEQRKFLLGHVDHARELLELCRVQSQGSLERGFYLDSYTWTTGAIPLLEHLLADLRQILTTAVEDFAQGAGSDNSPRAKCDEVIEKLGATTIDWESNIYGDFDKIRRQGQARYTQSLWVLGTTSILSVLLMGGLLRSFYNWVFHPIRDLMAGVGRIAQGNFEYSIEVKSGDEMQDLAAAFNDMTRRLCEIYRNLAHQVNERSRQLVRSERLASVGFLAAGVAHEINNPLASIAFCSEALEARLAEILGQRRVLATPGRSDSETIFKYLKMIQEEAFRCKDITQKLLEFSRSGERRREPTDLGELVQSVLDVAQHLQNGKGKHIVFEPPPKVRAWINAQEVKSVVLNLVVNALDSMEEGGVLTIGLEPRDGMAEVTFHDTGCGMTAEVLENIFEPFFTRSRTGKGTGLGLTISHRIVTGHGGEIEAGSAGPSQGSTFTVRLPLQPPAGERGSGGKDEADVSDPEALFRRRSAA